MEFSGYNITIDPNIKNGILSVKESTAMPSTPIKIEIKPDSGYKLKKGTLKYNNIPTGASYDRLRMPEEDIVITDEFENVAGLEEDPKEEAGLALRSTPTKIDYIVGENFDPTGFSARYHDGIGAIYLEPDEVKFITSKTIELTSDRPFQAAGTKKVTVTHKGFTITFDINVHDSKTVVPEIGPSDWAVNEINLADKAGLTYAEILSKYQQNITREEFCKLVVKFYEATGGEMPQVSQSPFADTSDKDVITANTLGIVNGVSDTEFAPNVDITREQISAMMMHAIKLFNTPVVTTDLTKFDDYNQISDWAVESLSYLNQMGIIKGMSDKKIAPLENKTREQAILIIYRAFNLFK